MACTPKELQEKIDKTIDKWFDDPLTVRLTSNSGGEYKKMYRAVTGKDFDYGDAPSEKSLDRLSKRIDKFQAKIKQRTPGKLAELFYLPEEFLKTNPVGKKTFDQFVINHNYFRGEKDKYNASMIKIADSLSNISKEMAIAERIKAPNMSKARRELQRRYNEYTKLLEESATSPAKEVAAEEYYQENLANLAKEQQFKVFEMADEVLRNPKLILQDKYKIFKPVVDEWQVIRPQLFNSLRNGLSRYVRVLESQNNAAEYKNVIDKLKELNDNLKPSENYFPTSLLNIFPTMKAITDSVYETKDSGSVNMEQLNTYVSSMVKNVLDRVPISGHLKEKTALPTDRRNKNVIGVLDNYIRDVTRFNYTVNTSATLIDGVRKLRDMSNEQTADAAKVYIDYLTDTHATMLGYNIQSPLYRSLARGITSWEFISKLGLNIRSAFRNATQSLQNFVYFGGKGWYEAEQYLKTREMDTVLKNEMERHGVFFEEARELAGVTGLFPDTQVSRVNGQEVMTWKTDTTGEKFLSGLETVAQKAGKPMSWVENKINRNLTFRVAFAKRHKQLSSERENIERFIDQHQDFFTKTEYGDTISKQVETHINNEAGRFAAEMVKEIHYEYSPFAKPKALRTAKGAVLGQFATYSINFFNYQRKIAKRGAEDILAGDWKSERAWRLYRLGMMQLFIDGVLSTATNSKFGNLIQNDTYERAKQFLDMASGDKERQRQAFFGKGPVIGTLGGPFVADMVTLGNVFGFYDLFLNFERGDPGLLGYLAGYHDYSGTRKSEKVFDVARTINSEIARQLFIVGPRMYNGAGFGDLVSLQTGIYPSRELKERKLAWIKQARKLPVVGKSIPIPSYAKKKKKASKDIRTEGENIMLALEGISKSPRSGRGRNKQMLSLLDSIKNRQANQIA